MSLGVWDIINFNLCTTYYFYEYYNIYGKYYILDFFLYPFISSPHALDIIFLNDASLSFYLFSLQWHFHLFFTLQTSLNPYHDNTQFDLIITSYFIIKIEAVRKRHFNLLKTKAMNVPVSAFGFPFFLSVPESSVFFAKVSPSPSMCELNSFSTYHAFIPPLSFPDSLSKSHLLKTTYFRIENAISSHCFKNRKEKYPLMSSNITRIYLDFQSLE